MGTKEITVRGINSRLFSKILTNILLIKNLPLHYRMCGRRKQTFSPDSPYQYLENLIKSHPEIRERTAIRRERQITYRQLQLDIEKIAGFLYWKCGTRKGENIAICGRGSIEGIESFFAMNKIGAINARIFNGAKREKIRENLLLFQPRTILTDSSNLSEIGQAICDSPVETLIVMDKAENDQIMNFQGLHPDIKIYQWGEVMAAQPPEIGHEQVTIKDPAAILYTSGSNGDPKPIMISNQVYVEMPRIVKTTTNQKICDGEKVVGVVSHEYPYAAINSTTMILLMGKTLILPDNDKNGGLDFRHLLGLKPHKIQAIPNFYKLLELYGQDEKLNLQLDFLKNIVSGGEVFLEEEKIETLSFMKKHGGTPLLIDGFGFGELGSATALKFGLNNYFLLMNGVRVKAVDPDTYKELESGREGILCITSPCIADGYYKNEEATRKAFLMDEKGVRWFVSDTYGSVHGLTKRLIKLGGRVREYFITGDGKGNFVKVYAGNVEGAIMGAGIVRDCIVVPSNEKGMPHPVAYVCIKEEEENLTTEEICEAIQIACAKLENFAQPVRIIVEKEIKRTPAGKKDYGFYLGKD